MHMTYGRLTPPSLQYATEDLQQMLFGDGADPVDGGGMDGSIRDSLTYLRSRVRSVTNIQGGYNSWRRHVDPEFPEY
jgi:hypothetical protein